MSGALLDAWLKPHADRLRATREQPVAARQAARALFAALRADGRRDVLPPLRYCLASDSPAVVDEAAESLTELLSKGALTSRPCDEPRSHLPQAG